MYHETLTKSCILLYKGSDSALSVLLYFTLKQLLTKFTSLKFNTLSTHLLNKQRVFSGKNVSVVLSFYNYSSILSLPNYSSIATYLTHYDSYTELLHTLIRLHKIHVQ